MVLRLIEDKMPLDEVVFYDTGMEFEAIYNVRNKMQSILEGHGIRYIELHPEEPFLYSMLEKPVYSKQKGQHNGYGWCGGVCRWGTASKIKRINRYVREEQAAVYVGIAADETHRMSRKTNRDSMKKYPLVEWGMTEADCLAYCRQRGFTWMQDGVDLYDILDRVSCWCCCNKNRKELFNIWKYLPGYWERLKELQAKQARPMKNYADRVHGFYGNLFQMEQVFEEEDRQPKQLDLWDYIPLQSPKNTR